jgi:hypothetical protein
MTDYKGYGRSKVTDSGKHAFRQVIGAAWHVTDNAKYKWLNDVVCVISGEVRRPRGITPEQLKQADVELVFDVAELVWEPASE